MSSFLFHGQFVRQYRALALSKGPKMSPYVNEVFVQDVSHENTRKGSLQPFGVALHEHSMSTRDHKLPMVEQKNVHPVHETKINP